MEKENIFYVYEWIRLDTNEPFYVGKGHGNRCYKTTRKCNDHFNNIVKSIPCAVNLLVENCTEQEALDFEVWYIYNYRDVIGYPLVNITDGGDGYTVTGKHHALYNREFTEEHRKNLSNAKKGKCCGENNSFYGKTHTDETRDKIRNSRLGTKASEETKSKLSEMRKGEGNVMYGRRGEDSPLFGRKHSAETNKKIGEALGTSVHCIELNITFESLSDAERYIRNNYLKKFSRKTLSNTLNNTRDKDWYGEILLDGVTTKLHWKYITN